MRMQPILTVEIYLTFLRVIFSNCIVVQTQHFTSQHMLVIMHTKGE